MPLIGVNFGHGDFWDDHDQCCKLVSTIAQHGYYYPILMVMDGQDDTNRIPYINSIFNHQLTVVQTGHISARSIIKNIDLLIGPSGAFSQYADLLSIPHIDIFTNYQNLYQEHAVGKNNLCLLTDQGYIEEVQILHALDYFSKPEISAAHYNYAGQSFQIEQDSFGAKLALINPWNVSKEIIAYEFYRLYLLSINDLLQEDTIGQSLLRYGKSLLEWQKFEEEKMIVISKDLLRTLRIIQQLKREKEIVDNQKQIVPLIKALDRLLGNIDFLSFTSIPLLVFQTNLHNAPQTNLKTMVRVVEKICYDLKNSLKIQLQLLSTIEQHAAKHSPKLHRLTNELRS